MSRQSPSRKRKVQAELEGTLLKDTEDVERRTGVNMSNLIRQGLVKVVREFRESGAIAIQPLPVAAEPARA